MQSISSEEFYDQLVESGLDFFTGVPDSLLKGLCACILERTPRGKNIIAANEGSAVGIACGHYISSGKPAVVYMQNSGEGNAINPLLSVADPDVYSIPMLLIIGWRGEPGVKDEPQHIKQGKVTTSLLETIGIPYEVLSSNWRTQIKSLKDTMIRESRPVALVVRKGVLGPHPLSANPSNFPLKREMALETILSLLPEDSCIVSTTGKTSREIFELREKRGEDHAHDFLTVGGMGHAVSIALGMATGSSRPIFCIDGDGAFLMHMGAVAIAAQNRLSSFRYILNNNSCHESVGGQPTVCGNLNLSAILSGMGFDSVYTASNSLELQDSLRTMISQPSSALIINTSPGSRADLGRPTVSPKQNKYMLMNAFADQKY